MEKRTSSFVVTITVMMIVMAFNTSKVFGAVCCNAYGTTVKCTPDSATSRPWTLCEILFPSQTSCPGDKPRPNVTRLLLESSGLKNLSLYSLHRFPKLEVIDLRHNHLSAFPRVQTGWLPQSVLKLDMSHNSLEALPRYAFRGLVRLFSLYLSHNQIALLSPGTFAGNPRLKVLDLSYNRLQRIFPSMFRRLTILATLNLNNNMLKALSVTSFSDLVCLKVLCLKNNYLTIFPGTVLKPLRRLETLIMKNNLLYELDISSVVSLNHISYVDVSLNSLPLNNVTLSDYSDPSLQMTMIISVSSELKTLKISSAFRPVSALPPYVEFRPSSNSVKSLDVSGTSFASCSLTLLSLTRLTSLDLSSGHCTTIVDSVFNRLPNLRNLSMANMRMDAEQFRVHSGRLFNKLTKLENLDLSGNQLYSLDARTLQFQTHLKTLNLAWNRFQSLPLEMAHLHKLSMLDLSHNILITLDPSDRMVLNTIMTNRSFDLSGNPFNCTCSNADFFHWWSSAVQGQWSSGVQVQSVEGSGLNAGPKTRLQCVSSRGEVMSIAQVLENCAANSPGLSTDLTASASLAATVVVVVVVVLMLAVLKVKGSECLQHLQQLHRQHGRTGVHRSDTEVEEKAPLTSSQAKRQTQCRDQRYRLIADDDASLEDSRLEQDQTRPSSTQGYSPSQPLLHARQTGTFQTTATVHSTHEPTDCFSPTPRSADSVQPVERLAAGTQEFPFQLSESEARPQGTAASMADNTSLSSEPGLTAEGFSSCDQVVMCSSNQFHRGGRYTLSSDSAQDFPNSPPSRHDGERSDRERSGRERSKRESPSGSDICDVCSLNRCAVFLPDMDPASQSSRSSCDVASDTGVKVRYRHTEDFTLKQKMTGADLYTHKAGFPELPRGSYTWFQNHRKDESDRTVPDLLNILNPSSADSSVHSGQFHSSKSGGSSFLNVENSSFLTTENSCLNSSHSLTSCSDENMSESRSHVSQQSSVSSSVESMSYFFIQNSSSSLLGDDFQATTSSSCENSSDLSFQTAASFSSTESFPFSE